jgi:uncharacterized glyoxalase superfamily protein PhnB
MPETAKPNPIPESYRRVTPCLVVRGAAKALDFYAEVFGAAERMRFPGPDGSIAHAEIQIGDSVVIVEDEDPRRGTSAPPAGGLMFVDTEEFAADLAAMGEVERERAYARVRQWFADHHDKITHHAHLMPPGTATTVRLDRGEPLVTDGPFVEGKEVVSGFTEIDVADLDEVDALAGQLDGYHLFHATRAELLRDLGHDDRARAADERALTLTANPAERSLLRQRLNWT